MFGFQKQKVYSLRKSHHLLQRVYSWYSKNWKYLPENELQSLEKDLESLDQAILQKRRQEASEKAMHLEKYAEERIKKSWFWTFFEFICAVVFALIIAIIVRQTWFELYEIPTGSMRPTYREKDDLLVTKTAFGINIPLVTDHFYFDPHLVKRGNIVIWTGDKIDLPDTDTTYFGILPAKKRYVKRLIGKPGDTLYFYGGKIYGIDQKGEEIKDLIDNPNLEKLEYIPFNSFEGRVIPSSSLPGGKINTLTFRQMNQPIGRTSITSLGKVLGEIHVQNEWKKDQPEILLKPHNQIETYSDFWGIRNYGVARLLTPEEAKQQNSFSPELGEGILYLELRHTPYLANLQSEEPSYAAMLPKVFTTMIPLQKEHLDTIMNAMYTSRFVVEKGVAKLYSAEGGHFTPDSPRFPGVPDGTYEFYYGKAEQIGWGAIAHELPKDHPLYKKTPRTIQRLFNLGIEFSERNFFTSRYAYFRNGDFFLMGAPILKKDDPTLIKYVEREKKLTSQSPLYVPFLDAGPPIENGHIQKDFVDAFGLKIPEKQYLVLGDNHARSADSRTFGFVPQENLQGSPTFLLWPPGSRWGTPPQTTLPWITLPNLVVWGIALFIFLCWYLFHYFRMQKPTFKRRP